MPVRAITLDFWNTLFRNANGARRQRLRIDAFSAATGAPPDAVDKALDTTWAEFARHHREEQRTLDPADAVRMAAETLGIAVEPDVAEELASVFATAILEHPPEPIDGALDAVRAAAEHAALGVVSDTGVSPGASLRVLLERHGFLDYFGVLNFSDEVGVAKPQRAMFETAARALGAAPEELLHIGDLEHSDIAGAKAFGAQAGLFTDANSTWPGATQADYVFHTWLEFIEALPALSGPA